MNILFPLVNADTWPKHERLGEAIKSEVLTELGCRGPPPSPPSHSAPPPDENNEQDDDSIIGVGIPAANATPEVMFDNMASNASDLWALTCTISHMCAGFDIFESYFGAYDEAVLHMVRTLGKLPD
ncbi:hypothetical protein MMC16_006615 [Acarospora aff. strigata]|nr:hypothetical protein [Acarospora aff. strigata]